MIRAQKSGLLSTLWSWYVLRKLDGAFRGVWERGEIPDNREGGLLVYANHPNFWDGFALHALATHHGWDAYCLMDEANLTRFPFLRRLGAFSIRPGDSASSLRSLRYAMSLLKKPRSMVAIFPEGELRPPNLAPLRLEPGVALLTKQARCSLALGLRYTFFEHERPDLLVELGTPHGPAPLDRIRSELSGCVSRVHAATSPEGFRAIRRGKRGMAERGS